VPGPAVSSNPNAAFVIACGVSSRRRTVVDREKIVARQQASGMRRKPDLRP
jgi:hypothetical protein